MPNARETGRGRVSLVNPAFFTWLGPRRGKIKENIPDILRLLNFFFSLDMVGGFAHFRGQRFEGAGCFDTIWLAGQFVVVTARPISHILPMRQIYPATVGHAICGLLRLVRGLLRSACASSLLSSLSPRRGCLPQQCDRTLLADRRALSCRNCQAALALSPNRIVARCRHDGTASARELHLQQKRDENAYVDECCCVCRCCKRDDHILVTY